MIHGQTCETCAHFAALQNQCREKSPTAFVIPVNGQLKIVGEWPSTRKDNWCSAWKGNLNG